MTKEPERIEPYTGCDMASYILQRGLTLQLEPMEYILSITDTPIWTKERYNSIQYKIETRSTRIKRETLKSLYKKDSNIIINYINNTY